MVVLGEDYEMDRTVFAEVIVQEWHEGRVSGHMDVMETGFMLSIGH